MPILLDSGPAGCRILAGPESLGEKAPARSHLAGAEWIEIGLVNNMPDAALEATERQFLDLLNAAAGQCWLHVRFYSLPDVPRSERGRSHVRQSYFDVGELWGSDVDALIVTGTEPKAANLADEPYWTSFTKLIDWAEHNTISTIWSCLAAHAAVLHTDGVDRSALGEKRFGLFDYEKISDHPIMADLPSRLRIPHSRYNELGEDALVASGYNVLTNSPDAGIDMFVRQRKSLFVFLQGHPEYEERTLLSEYRRDIGRFLRRERGTYPSTPQGYFDDATAEALAAFGQQALLDQREELLAQFPTALAEAGLKNTWRSFGVAIYRNWLSYILAQKIRQLSPTRYVASLRLDRAANPAV